MTPERWRAVEAVLHAALERPTGERRAYVADACGGDAALRHEVESLLAVEPETGFLEHGALPDDTRPSQVRERLTAALAGRYALERELGRGGMAMVFLARDERHRRRVAIKVLHPELAAALGAERFLKEIELTASLQHPHILPLFDSGSSADGLLYYVMPYVDGETLRERLAREGHLPVDEAVRVAREVASALDYAHRQGVIHRDIKPENILLHEGQALVADFGIALAVQTAAGARLTQTGLSIGTPQYMSPEQATGGRTIDARSDVYALGTVTYEMLAGEPPFTGPSAQAIIGRMLSEEPRPVSALRTAVPSHVAAAVRRALQKIPADRFASAAAFADALAAPANATREPPAGDTAPVLAPPAARGRSISRRTATMLAAGALALLAAGWALGRATDELGAPARASLPVRFSIVLDSGSLGESGPLISPDGRTIVFRYEDASGVRLYARRVDELEMRPLAGTENAQPVCFSPDGAWLAFYTGRLLRKVRMDGGQAVTIADAPWLDAGSWAPDGTIYFGMHALNGLWRVPADGGTPSRIALADTSQVIRDPHLLPDGRTLLVTMSAATSLVRFGLVDLATGRVRELGAGFGARHVAGSIVFGTLGGEMYRQPFDLERLALSGRAQRLGDGLAYVPNGSPFAVSPAGTLVYRAGGSVAPTDPAYLRLVVTDRAGRELRAIPARLPWTPRLSPDGRRVAYGAHSSERERSDLWITDLASGGTQRVTTDGNENSDPQWSPDGRAIAYSADAGDAKDLYLVRLGGAGARVLVSRPGYQFPLDWLRDGSGLLFVDVQTAGERLGNQDIWVQPLDGGAARPYIASPASEIAARASPDGRWVAYTGDETGRYEVYVESYPTPGRKTAVSTAGGGNPVWRGDGRELFYWQGEQLMSARLEPGSGDEPLVVRERTPLFRAPYPGSVVAMYDVTADGERFVLVRAHAFTNRLVVVMGALDADAAGPRDDASKR